MPHQTPLITTIVLGLGLSFVFGALANRLRLSPLAGYLVAGVIIGPFTPGYVADQAIASQLAELGIILLMFGVGLHFSLRELLSVRAIAISRRDRPDDSRFAHRHQPRACAGLVDRRRRGVRPRSLGREHRRGAGELREKRLI
jgi:Sodium/hydrogen exchanger family